MIAVAMAFALAACSSDTDATTSAEAAPATVGFPTFVASTVDGGQIDLGSIQGTDVVLWMWAPW